MVVDMVWRGKGSGGGNGFGVVKVVVVDMVLKRKS